jgi:glycosidase
MVALAVVLALLAVACGRDPATPTPVATASPAPASPTRGACSIAPPVPVEAVPWWSERVFYEVFVRSFADSDGDGIGDLRGLTDRLDYLNDGDPAGGDDLGITGIWLMPVAEAASYHGYDVTDYRAIEQDYGTLEDFQVLVAAAHERGIAVIVDLVLNHTSSEHPWFQDSRTPGSEHADWYIWSDEDPHYGGGFGQQVWHPDGERFYYAQFVKGMPDLDLENPDVTAELDGVARYWLDDLDVDGFRLDAVKHFVEEGQEQEDTPATHAWLAGFQDRIEAVKPDALLVGEVLDLTLRSSSYVPDAVDLTFDFELADKTILALQAEDAATFRGTQVDVLEAYPPHGYAALLSNHDQPRIASQLSDPAALRAGASILLTNPGLPFMYYGEELGLTGPKPDERIRSPLPWDGRGPGGGFTTGTPWEPLEDGWETRNVTAGLADPASLLAHYRALIAVRASHPALASGEFTTIDAGSPAVYGFVARSGDDAIVVLVNLGADVVTDLKVAFDSPIACGVTGAELVYADAGVGKTPSAVTTPDVAPDGSIAGWQPVPTIGPRGTLILALER